MKKTQKKRIKIGIIKSEEQGWFILLCYKFKNWQHQEALEMNVSKEDLKGMNASFNPNT